MLSGILLATVFCLLSLLFDPTTVATAHKGLPIMLWVTFLMYVTIGGQQTLSRHYIMCHIFPSESLLVFTSFGVPFSFGFPSSRVALQEFGPFWFPIFPATRLKIKVPKVSDAIEDPFFWVPQRTVVKRNISKSEGHYKSEYKESFCVMERFNVLYVKGSKNF